MLFQNQDQQSELRKEVEVTLKQFEDEHRTKERELKTDNRALKVQVRRIFKKIQLKYMVHSSKNKRSVNKTMSSH